MSEHLTPHPENSLFRGVMKELTERGLESFIPVFQSLLNEAMKVERSEYLHAAPHERTSLRQGYANGFKPKTVMTRSGPLELEIPQVRDSSFYPQSLEKGCRSELALKLALAEMYVSGVSTRKVERIAEKLCGHSISSTQVSALSQRLDEELNKFRNRPLGRYPYVFLDATYQRIRFEGSVRSLAVLVAIGIDPQGRKSVLGVSVSLSEAEVHWRDFFQSLAQRGLSGVNLIISDDHPGLKAARQSVFPSVPWQRCQFHLSRNAQAYASSQTMRAEIAQAMRDIFNAPSLELARAMVKRTAEKYSKNASKFAAWLEENVEESFTIFLFPRQFCRKLRTSNSMERLNLEIKRRTRVATLFPNQESCLRLVTAVLQEIDQDWATGRTYMLMPDFKV